MIRFTMIFAFFGLLAAQVPCPETPPVDGEPCQLFIGDTCDYGDEVCCPDDTERSNCVPTNQCECSWRNVTSCTSEALSCSGEDTEMTLTPGESCDFSSQLFFQYGDPFYCKVSFETFPSERECRCVDGVISCTENACPAPCPEMRLVEGDTCVRFANFYCSYDIFCCPDDDTNCVTDAECFCGVDEFDNQSVRCFEFPIDCPGSCPTEVAKTGDSCSLEERINCRYTDDLSDGPDEVCNCVEGAFMCTTPSDVTAPVAPPVQPPTAIPGDDDDDDDDSSSSSSSDSMKSNDGKKGKRGKKGGSGGSKRRLVRSDTN